MRLLYIQKRKTKLASWLTISIQPPQGTKWKSVQTRQVMTNNPNGFQREIKIKGQRLQEVENFKYLGAIISNEGSKPEIVSRIAQTTAALSRLKTIWRDKNILLAFKVKLMPTLILSTFLYACESWTLTAEIERRMQALEMRCYRRLLNISYEDHVTNKEVRNRIQNATGWVAENPMFLHADSEDSDQTGQMPRLIWVFAGHKVILLVLSWGSSTYLMYFKIFISFSDRLYIVKALGNRTAQRIFPGNAINRGRLQKY